MSGLETSARVDEEFAKLVYSDSEWLRAEFEALMTAGFGALHDSRSSPRRRGCRRLATPARSAQALGTSQDECDTKAPA